MPHQPWKTTRSRGVPLPVEKPRLTVGSTGTRSKRRVQTTHRSPAFAVSRGDMPENRLLGELPPLHRDRLLVHATPVSLALRDEVYRAGGPIDYVYFPQTGILSSVVSMQDGGTAEVTGTGSEGMVGVTAALGASTSHEKAFCQVPPCVCWKIPAVVLASEVAAGGAIREVIYPPRVRLRFRRRTRRDSLLT